MNGEAIAYNCVVDISPRRNIRSNESGYVILPAGPILSVGDELVLETADWQRIDAVVARVMFGDVIVLEILRVNKLPYRSRK